MFFPGDFSEEPTPAQPLGRRSRRPRNHCAQSRLSSPNAASAISASTSKHTRISMFFPLPFPTAMGWLHSCTSKAQSARQDNCCAAVQPSHAVATILRKSARIVSSSFFSEKKKLKASKRLQRTLLGPQPKLQANAVLSKTAKCLARERTRSRAQKDNYQTALPCCCAQREKSTFPKGTKIHPPQHLPPTATANAKSRAAGSKLPAECSAEPKRLLHCRCKPELL